MFTSSGSYTFPVTFAVISNSNFSFATFEESFDSFTEIRDVSSLSVRVITLSFSAERISCASFLSDDVYVTFPCGVEVDSHAQIAKQVSRAKPQAIAFFILNSSFFIFFIKSFLLNFFRLFEFRHVDSFIQPLLHKYVHNKRRDNGNNNTRKQQ